MTTSTMGTGRRRTQHGLRLSFFEVSGRVVLVVDGSPDRIRTGATALRGPNTYRRIGQLTCSFVASPHTPAPAAGTHGAQCPSACEALPPLNGGQRRLPW
jgi:hypothetical protein